MVDLREPWSIGPVEIPTRLVLAPMAGVSVQAFRRQGRRFGAGLVCSEMVSCAGIEHRNERTLGYLRVACRRASARDPAVRLGARVDGRGRAHGRGGRRRPRRPQLRLPRAEGDEDRRRRDAARRSRPRRADRLRDRRRGRHPGQRQAAPRPARRVARLPRRRAAARRGGRRVADAASALRAADVHGHGRPRADGRARRRSSTSLSSRPGTSSRARRRKPSSRRPAPRR